MGYIGLLLLFLLPFPVTCVRWGLASVNPGPINLFASATCGSFIFLFGGFQAGQISNELYGFDMRTRTWSKVYVEGEKPVPRSSPYLFCREDTLVLVSGNTLEQVDLSDVWFIHLAELKWHRGILQLPTDNVHADALRSRRDGVAIGTRAVFVAQDGGARVGEIELSSSFESFSSRASALQGAVQHREDNGSMPFNFSLPHLPEPHIVLNYNASVSLLNGQHYCQGGFLGTGNTVNLLIPAPFSNKKMENSVYLFHLDSHRGCQILTSGLDFPIRYGGVAAEIIRIPVYLLHNVASPNRGNITTSSEFPPPREYKPSSQEVARSIVGWRTVLVVAFGCGRNIHALDVFCPAPHGPGRGAVYVLDLTPLYRHMPHFVKVGLDPRLTSSDGFPRTNRTSCTTNEPCVGSFPGPSPRWEAEIVRTSANNTWPRFHCDASNMEENHQFCNISAPLRWRRVYAAGKHVLWHDNGLSLTTPMEGVPWAHWVTNFNSSDSTLNLELSTDEGMPFLEYPEAGVVVNISSPCNETGTAGLKYPILSTSFSAAEEGYDALQGVRWAGFSSIGGVGRLGWLGVPSILVHGGEYRFSGLMGSALLELFGSIHEDTAVLLGISANGTQRLTLQQEEALDTAAIFWGSWSDVGAQQGFPPPTGYTANKVEFPASRFAVSSKEALMPHSSLVANDLAEAPIRPEGIGFLDEEEVALLENATVFYENVLLSGAFGSAAFGFDLALRTPQGFARWPQQVVTLWQQFNAELQDEKVMLVTGACKAPRRGVLQFIFCLDFGEHNFEVFELLPLLMALMASGDLMDEYIHVLHPATLQWWDIPLEVLPPVPPMKTRVACDFIELNESILALPGGRAQIKPGVGLGISLAETTILQLNLRDPIPAWVEVSNHIMYSMPPPSVRASSPYAAAPLNVLERFHYAATAATCPSFILNQHFSRSQPEGAVSPLTPEEGELLGCIHVIGGGEFTPNQIQGELTFRVFGALNTTLVYPVYQSPNGTFRMQTWEMSWELQTSEAFSCIRTASPSITRAGDMIFTLGGISMDTETNEAVVISGFSEHLCEFNIPAETVTIREKLGLGIFGSSMSLVGQMLVFAHGYSSVQSAVFGSYDIVEKQLNFASSRSAAGSYMREGYFSFHSWPDFTVADAGETDASRAVEYFYPDLLMRAPAIPIGREGALCSDYGTRWACWGGFLAEFSTQVTDTATLWTGIHLLSAHQRRLGSAASEQRLKIEDISPVLVESSTLDKACLLKERPRCGSLQTSLLRLSQPDHFSFHRDLATRIQVKMESDLITGHVTIETPVVFFGDPNIRRTLVCSTQDTDGNHVWPWLGTSDNPERLTPCIALRQGTATPSFLSSFAVMPLHELLLRQSSPRLQVPGTWTLTSFPFMVAMNSWVMLEGLKVQHFGYVLPTHLLRLIPPLKTLHPFSRGGCIVLDSSRVLVANSSISECTAFQGGALSVSFGSLMIKHSQLVNNTALKTGGAMELHRAVVEVFQSSFGGNRVLGESDDVLSIVHEEGSRVSTQFGYLGGAVNCFGSNSFSVNECHFINNTAIPVSNEASYGGGLATTFCSLHIMNTAFEGNQARSGGAVFIRGGVAELLKTQFRRNGATLHGGGLAVEESSSLNTEGLVLSSNEAQGSGGGLFVSSPFGRVIVREAVLKDNTAHWGSGGGIALTSTQTQSSIDDFLFLEDTQFMENEAPRGGGGAVYFEGLSPRFSENSTTVWDTMALHALQDSGDWDSDFQVGSLTFLGNFGRYGSTVATEARRLELTLNGTHVIFNSQGRLLPSHHLPTVAVVDAFHQLVKSDNDSLVRLTPQREEAILSCANRCTLELTGATIIRVVEGKGVFTGLKALAPPGCCTTVVASTGELDSNSLLVQTEPCPPGFGRDTSSRGCVPCTPGRFSPQATNKECISCPAGSASYLSQATACTLCPPGRYAQEGRSKCDSCESGQFSGLGWSSCLSCPQGVSCSSGKLHLVNNVWLDRFTIAKSQLQHELVQQVWLPALQLWASQNCVNAWPHQSVHEQLATAGFSLPVDMLPDEVAVDVLQVVDSTRFLPCYHQGACLTTCNSTVLTCRDGHHGVFCGQCQADWAFDGSNCRPCDYPVALKWAITIGVATGVIGFVLFQVLTNLNEGNTDAGQQTSGSELSGTILRVFLNFTQVASILSAALVSSGATSDILKLGDAGNGISLSLHPVACSLSFSYYDNFKAYMILPLLAVILPFLVTLLTFHVHRRVQERRAMGRKKELFRPRVVSSATRAYRVENSLRGQPGNQVHTASDTASDATQNTAERKCVNKKILTYSKASTIVLLFLLYPRLTRSALSMFHIYSEGVSNSDGSLRYYLQDDLSIEAFDNVHGSYMVVAGLGVILYVIGIPLVAMILLYHQKKRFQHSTNAYFSFLYEGYDISRGLWWWEAIVLLRKVLLTTLIVFVSEPQSQALLVITVQSVDLAFHLMVYPYKSLLLNRLETLGLSALYATMIFFLSRWKSPEDAVVVTLLIGVIAIGLLSAFVLISLLGIVAPRVPAVWRKLSQRRAFRRCASVSRFCAKRCMNLNPASWKWSQTMQSMNARRRSPTVAFGPSTRTIPGSRDEKLSPQRPGVKYRGAGDAKAVSRMEDMVDTFSPLALTDRRLQKLRHVRDRLHKHSNS